MTREAETHHGAFISNDTAHDSRRPVEEVPVLFIHAKRCIAIVKSTHGPLSDGWNPRGSGKGSWEPGWLYHLNRHF